MHAINSFSTSIKLNSTLIQSTKTRKPVFVLTHSD